MTVQRNKYAWWLPRLFLLLGWTVSFFPQSVLAETPDFWEQLFGPADVTAISGNGGLTVGVNAFGRLSSCQWPSPGGNDQLSYRTVSRDLPNFGVKPEHGAQWAIRTDQGVFWLAGAPWQTEQHYASDASTEIVTISRLPDSPLTATQHLFVCAKRDVLVWRLHIAGVKDAPKMYWYANFTPCTRQLPEIPIADWMLDGLNDFAVFAAPDTKTIYHFRPEKPSAADWERAGRLAARKAPAPEWDAFAEGVWIGYAGSSPFRTFQCGEEYSETGVLPQIETGHLKEDSCATGQCHSAIELIPQPEKEGFTAELFVAFGHNRDQVDAGLRHARKQGCRQLEQDTQNHWMQWLAEGGITGNPPEGDARTRALLTIIQCMDRETGGIVRSPITQPPWAMDSARYGAWVTLALDCAGYHGLAEKHTRFYLDTLRSSSKPGLPKGSMPAAVSTNQAEFLPHIILETDSPAWLLGSVWHHVQSLDIAERPRYLKSIWQDLVSVTRFLSDWSQVRVNAPLPVFQPALCRDGRGLLSVLHAYMGMTAAARMAELLHNDEASEWAARAQELEAQVQFHCLNNPGPLPLPPYYAYWLEGIVPRDDQTSWQLWDAEVQSGELCVPLKDIRHATEHFLTGYGEPSYPDSWRAALQLIAAAAH